MNNTPAQIEEDVCDMAIEESQSISYHPLVQISLEVLCVGGVATGIVANNIVIWIILANKSLHGRTNWYILNLCVANCVAILGELPLNVMHLSGSCEIAKIIFNDNSCLVLVYLSESIPDVSMITLTLMVIERYFALVHPLLAIRVNRVVSLRAKLAFSWILPMVTFMPKMFFKYTAIVTNIVTPYGNITQVKCREEDHMSTGYHYYAASVDSWVYVFAAVTIAIANARIAIMLRRRWHAFHERRASVCFKDQVVVQDEETRKITRILSCVSAVYVIAWVPVSVYHFLMELQVAGSSYESNMHLLLDCLFLSSLALSPVMFLVMCKRFRLAAITELHKLNCAAGRKRSLSSTLQPITTTTRTS